jgi:hemolysin activation/secretion protein
MLIYFRAFLKGISGYFRKIFMSCLTRIICLGFVLFFLRNSGGLVFAQGKVEHTIPGKTEIQLKEDKKAQIAEQVEAEREAAEKAREEAELGKLSFPEDTSSRFRIKELRISGNKLISTDELLSGMPLVYNVSSVSAEEAEPGDLYDLRVLHQIISDAGQPREVSRRTMYGLTQYLLSAYTSRGYAGVYVYISADAVSGKAVFKDDVLPIEIVEGVISEIIITSYDQDRNRQEKGYLRSSVIEEWSPSKVGGVINKKKLDDFVNLLNHNPDRYISAVISRGSEPNSLALGYDVYEVNPWHYYIQVDNAGTKERRWAPRFGVVNTNLTGRDDKFSTVYQAPLESDFDDNHSYYASYEFPLYTPRLRLNLFGGRSEFDISGGGGISFLGKGSFYGGILRYNICQREGWFFDVTTSLTQEHSKVTTPLFAAIGSDVRMNLLGVGANAYRSDDTSSTSLGFNRVENIGGSSQKRFWDPSTGTGARTNADRDFAIYTVSAAHSRFLDPNNIHRISGSSKFIFPNERLAPSKMTTFGGLYSVRGYKEDEIVADGGMLLSGQYEFDLTKHNMAKDGITPETEGASKKRLIKKMGLLVFSDYARAKTKHSVAGEKGSQELWSVGLGMSTTFGNNVDAAIYYGYPLKSTDDTRKGSGRWSFSFIYRW